MIGMNTICSRCQLPTEAEEMAGGWCGPCQAAEKAYAAHPNTVMLDGREVPVWFPGGIMSDAQVGVMLTGDQRERLLRGEWIVQPTPQVAGMSITSLDVQ